MKITSASFALMILSSLMLLPACSNQAPKVLDGSDLESLEQRVSARWTALIAKDFGAAYDYTTPTYRRTFPKRLYVNNFSPLLEWQLTRVELLNYDASAAVASVAVRVMSKSSDENAPSAIFGAIPQTLRERWIYRDGEWWYSNNY